MVKAMPAKVEFNGKQITLIELARRYDLATDIVRARLKWGWTIEQALELEPRSIQSRSAVKFTYGDQSKSIREWGAALNLSENVIRTRLNVLKWSLGEALGFEQRVNKKGMN